MFFFLLGTYIILAHRGSVKKYSTTQGPSKFSLQRHKSSHVRANLRAKSEYQLHLRKRRSKYFFRHRGAVAVVWLEDLGTVDIEIIIRVASICHRGMKGIYENDAMRKEIMQVT